MEWVNQVYAWAHAVGIGVIIDGRLMGTPLPKSDNDDA